MAKRPTRLRFTEDDLADSHVKKAADRADKAVDRAEKAADKLASKKAKPKLSLPMKILSLSRLAGISELPKRALKNGITIRPATS